MNTRKRGVHEGRVSGTVGSIAHSLSPSPHGVHGNRPKVRQSTWGVEMGTAMCHGDDMSSAMRGWK